MPLTLKDLYGSQSSQYLLEQQRQAGLLAKLNQQNQELNAQETAGRMARANQADQAQLAQLNQAGAASQSLADTGQDMWNTWRQTYLPLQGKLAAAADMPEDMFVGQAAANVDSAYNTAAQAQQRDLQRMGVNPNSGKFAGLAQNMAINQAGDKAGAMTNARITGNQMRFDRLNAANAAGNTLANMGTQTRATGLSGLLNTANAQGQMASEWGSLAKEQNPLGGVAGLPLLGGQSEWSNALKTAKPTSKIGLFVK